MAMAKKKEKKEQWAADGFRRSLAYIAWGWRGAFMVQLEPAEQELMAAQVA